MDALAERFKVGRSSVKRILRLHRETDGGREVGQQQRAGEVVGSLNYQW